VKVTDREALREVAAPTAAFAMAATAATAAAVVGLALAARALRRRIGDAAPLWVAVFLFASVAFA